MTAKTIRDRKALCLDSNDYRWKLQDVRIPKLIHYCWFGGKPIPRKHERFMRSWAKFCPGFEIVRWDEASFDFASSRFAREAYESERFAFVSDAVRLWAVLNHGGVYLDTDVELVSGLDHLLQFGAFFGFEEISETPAINTGQGFGSIAHHPIVLELFKNYEASGFISVNGAMDERPCPERDASIFADHGFAMQNSYQAIGDVVVLPTEYFCPKSYLTGQITITDRTIGIHHFGGSWLSPSEQHQVRRRHYINRYGVRVGRAFALLDRLRSKLVGSKRHQPTD